jgi:predicted DNA-binding WGR domain protein
MAKLEIEWSRVGPPRPESRPVPPVSMRLNGYVLDFAEDLGAIVYVCGSGYDGFGEAWTWDGTSWQPLARKLLNLSGEGRHQGYWDPSRKAMIVHRFGYDSESETHRPETMIVDSKGARALRTKGEFPLAGDDSDLAGAFGFDRVRGLGVCLTPHGVWTLDAAGSWSRAADAAELVPSEWKEDVGAVWNPIRETLFFWLYESDDYTHVFLEWDGTQLRRLPSVGLPHDEEGRLREFHIGLFNPSASFVGHARHGVLLCDGPREFAFDGERWHELPPSQDPPPRMQEGRLAYDPVRDAIVLGPGYHEGDSGGRDAQRVFFEQHAGRWSRSGVAASDSPTAKASKHLYFTCGGESFCASPRELWTWAYRDGEWIETFSEAQGDALVARDWIGNIVDMGDHALAVARTGRLYRCDGASWTKTKESVPEFGERTDFVLARRDSGDELIIWGGEVKNRKSNDTFFLEHGKWHKNKKASPRPADFAHGKDDIYVDFEALWDSSLQRFVRFGFDEVATLEGELWQGHVPKHYAKLAGSRRFEHLPVHDRESGETLLVNLEKQTVLRFDLSGCTQVATLTLPDELEPKEQHDTPAWARIRDDVWYDPSRKTLEAQHVEDRYGRYRWELGPAFEAAAKLGPRTKLAGHAEPIADAPVEDVEALSVCLYSIEEGKHKVWACTAAGTEVLIRSGKLGGPLEDKRVSKKSAAAAREHAQKQIAAKRGQGFVDAKKLKAPAIAAMVAVESSALTVGKPRKRALEDHAIDRIGGMPSGISAKDWPELGGEPAGFLIQIDTTEILRKHAAVAVFCSTDGTATEDEDNNAVVLIKPGKWAKAPIEDAPEGVVPLAVRPLSRAKPKLEIVESRVQALAEQDSELAAAVERFGAGKQVHGELPWSKVGGQPHWVQGGELGDDWMLVAQLDFDGLQLDEWPDAGLFGVLYILVSRDEQQAVATWQYT